MALRRRLGPPDPVWARDQEHSTTVARGHFGGGGRLRAGGEVHDGRGRLRRMVESRIGRAPEQICTDGTRP